jgi:hypothetical protein
MAMPHFLFWPFDVGISESDRERTRAKTHIADSIRVGVLANEEGAEIRIEAHLMGCEVCHENSISLWERVRAGDLPPIEERYSCPQARNELLRHLEEDRPLTEPTLVHLMECPACADHFLEPAKALHTLEVDEEAAAAQD